jgi:dTDP-4-dehydrorhamnose 3,5-epimerase
MKIINTGIIGVKYIELDTWLDDRGAFVEAFVDEAWRKAGIDFDLIQVNYSKSDKAGTIRGMHWQDAPAAQGKIVFAVNGPVFDAVTDVRKHSHSFGKSVGYELFPQVNAIFIPKGVAHGYQALEDRAGLVYLVDAPYSPVHECGIRYDDPDAGIRWPLKAVNVAPKDLKWPTILDIR